MKATTEFKVGKHNIMWVDPDFTKAFKGKEFKKAAMPKFKKLPRSMTDTEIEDELQPGFCTLGDIVAFLDNPPEGAKDGWSNLFYTPTCVVGVDWGEDGWSVLAFYRGGSRWFAFDRVFSPATRSSDTKSSDLDSFVSRAEFEAWKKKVESVLKI